MQHPDPQEFRSSSFQNTKQWLHFNIDNDLQNCRGCRKRARQVIGEKRDHPTWFCSACHEEARTPLSLHPVVRAILDGDPVPKPRCDRTGERIDISEAWISSDCRRIYKRQIARRDQATRQIEATLRTISPCPARSETHFMVRPISEVTGSRITWDDGAPVPAEAVSSTQNGHGQSRR